MYRLQNGKLTLVYNPFTEDWDIKQIDFSRPARTSLITKCKFYAVRMLQTGLGKKDPEYTDYKYWKNNGWIDKARPWR